MGWTFTIDEYFELFVESIYDTVRPPPHMARPCPLLKVCTRNATMQVVEALAANPARKFIAVEMAYFYKWWQIADVGQKITTQRV